MDRRDFLLGVGSTALLASALSTEAAEGGAKSQSSEALAQLRQTIADLEKGLSDPAWRLMGPQDVAEGRRFLSQATQHALQAWAEPEPAYPAFVRFVTPEKKLLGDNPDAIYYTTPVSAEYEYRIRGNLADATYTSFSVETRSTEGGSGGVGAALNDTEFEADANGDFEIIASATKKPGNWLPLPKDAVSISTRHYYEREKSVAADRLHHVPLMIENVSKVPPRPAPTDASVAAGLRRADAFLKGVVVPPTQPDETPRWVSTTPNQLPQPIRDDAQTDIGFAAKDNVYSMCPFVLKPDQALVIEGRYPECRFANVVLWNRFLQTLDYQTRQVSLNRKQTQLEPDGSYRIVIAATDPGVPNWIDNEGRFVGTVFWRFLLPEGDIEPFKTSVVPTASLTAKT